MDNGTEILKTFPIGVHDLHQLQNSSYGKLFNKYKEQNLFNNDHWTVVQRIETQESRSSFERLSHRVTRMYLKPNFFLPSDIDECTTKTDNCDVNAACTNTVGSHVCACKFGSSGDGITCYGNY